MQIYVVQPNDNVDTIAAAYGVSPDTVIYDNQLVYPYKLAVGQALYLPSGSEEPTKTPLTSNGYAYPYISPWVLGQTLPFLTRLSIFSYGFTFDGELLPPVLDDTWMIRAALGQRTAPILTLTPLGADGQFNNALINSVVRNPQYSQKLTWQLVSVLQEKGYQGVDIDFEYILSEDRDFFTEFVRKTADTLHTYGFTLSVALAPKTSAYQKGLLYEGKDYPALGEIADYVLLMTYEWGFKHGPNMAVAPLNKVRQVVDYAVTEINPQKIHLGIPNYGYDWPLPFVSGRTVARTIGNVEAVQLAIQNGAEIQFDETAQSPFFRYVYDGVEHEVWFEDVRSIRAKFMLVKEYGLGGVGYWQIMRWWRANWLLLEDFFDLESVF